MIFTKIAIIRKNPETLKLNPFSYHCFWFSLENVNFRSKIQVLKFLGIKPTVICRQIILFLEEFFEYFEKFEFKFLTSRI